MYVSNGKRPFWQTIIAAMFFTVAVYFLYLFFSQAFLMSSDNVKSFGAFLEAAAVSFTTGLGFSIVVDYQFDFDELRYKKLFCIGPIRVGRWNFFQALNYISVYRNTRDEFEINLWYNTNKHFMISTFQEMKPALNNGQVLANKLKLDLLDATNPRDTKWL